jgi:hypothetical protein
MSINPATHALRAPLGFNSSFVVQHFCATELTGDNRHYYSRLGESDKLIFRSKKAKSSISRSAIDESPLFLDKSRFLTR